jgi:hypothetical protein
MTCLAARTQLSLAPQPSKWDVARAAVFWAFILLVIVSPAVLGALILAQG